MSVLCLMKVNKHRKLANNALLPAPKWIPAVISPNYISPTPEDQLKPLPCTVDGSMEGHFSSSTSLQVSIPLPGPGEVAVHQETIPEMRSIKTLLLFLDFQPRSSRMTTLSWMKVSGS